MFNLFLIGCSVGRALARQSVPRALARVRYGLVESGKSEEAEEAGFNEQ